MQNIMHFPIKESALNDENGMEQISENGTALIVVDGLHIANPSNTVKPAKFGVVIGQLGKYPSRGKATAIAQFYSIVGPGLILAKHVFRGLKRPLLAHDNMEADAEKLVYSWKPRWDYEWKGGPTGGSVKKTPPDDRVFVTIVSPNNDQNFPTVAGWIEHWNWVHEAGDLKDAPIDWGTRYTEKLWSAP